MNVNENAPVLNRRRGATGRQLKYVPIQRTRMGPPTHPAPKPKESNNSTHTTPSSSTIIWRPNKTRTQAHSTTVGTSSSSRSHSSSEPESRVVIALSESRGQAVCEVGIAAINIARPSLILCQISDSQSYINTLTKINILNPTEILIPLTFIKSITPNRLLEKVKEQFPDIKITGVTRSIFNKTTGLQYVKQLCVPSMNSIILILQHRYYALSAAAALLIYTESALYVTYANESIKIEYQESEGSTIIDVATADRLELVASARPTMKKRFSCLLDVLNHCVTKIGSRTLRASILQPPCSVPVIEARLNCVSELVENPDLQNSIEVVLSNLSNIDQLLTLATVLPDQAQNCSERQLNYILLLNTVLEQIEPLKDVFENSTQPFFIELVATLSNPAYIEIKELVRTLINTDAHPGKGENGIFQRCFAIKSGINSLLDLIRKSYSERIEDMRNYVTRLGEEHSLTLVLHNNNKKGYHIVLNLSAYQKKSLKRDDLPPECIQVERLAGSYTMKTQYLITLSHRVEDIMAEILKMSNIMIYKLLIQIRSQIGIFYKLCEDIAKLDMLQSLAKASSALYYVRPKFSEYLEVIQARHPLLDFLCSQEPSANSMYASEAYNMNIITGPNGSGKSIFVRQVILIQVMAQVGCYVPAQSATLRVSDRILARVYLEDNMDCGASAFVLEMKEIQYFLTVLTKNTLIIIDELCRSTSVEEGTALAMAVCEKLMTTSAFVFFTTHFKLLCKLQDLHFCVKTWQLETLTDTKDNQMILHFTYNVIPGVTSLEHYGMFLAKGSWPEIIIKYAEEILKKLSNSNKRPSPHIETVSAAARLKYDLEAELQMFKAKKELTRARINERLVKYQKDLEGFGHQADLLLVSNHDNESYHNGSQIQPNSNQCFDYFNLQGQSQDNISDISENISYLVADPVENRNYFENLFNNNQEVPQIFNFENNNQDKYSFFSENLGSNNQSAITDLEEYPGSFLNYSNNLSEQEIDDTFNISLKMQNNFIFQKESTTVGQNIKYNNAYTTSLSYHEEYSYTITKEDSALVRDSIASRENSIFFNENSIYLDNDTDNELINSQSSNYAPQPINVNKNKICDESFLSINEQQFSLPLQQHLERTSTPEITPLQGQFQQLSMWNQNLHNPWANQSNNVQEYNPKQIKTNSSTPTKEQDPKSDSTKSGSIKWMPTTSVFKTPNGSTPKTSSTKSVVKVDKNKQSSNNNNTNSKSSSNSIKSNLVKKNSSSYSQADITEILNDLQSCSEYFSDSQDWDLVDEEVKSKLDQSSNNYSKVEAKVDRPSQVIGTHQQQWEEKFFVEMDKQSLDCHEPKIVADHKNISQINQEMASYGEKSHEKNSQPSEWDVEISRQSKGVEKPIQTQIVVEIHERSSHQLEHDNKIDEFDEMSYSESELSQNQPHLPQITTEENKHELSGTMNDDKDSNHTPLSTANKHIPLFNRTKSSNGSCKEDSSQQKPVPLQHITLEPLGDIHLELFSDESIFDEPFNEIIEENRSINKSSSLNLIPTHDHSKIPPDSNIPAQKRPKLSLIGPKTINLTSDEYETAQSMLDSSLELFDTPCSFFEPEFTSTPASINQKIDLSPKIKRKRLGYVDNKNLEGSRKEIPIKETSSDLFEEIQPLLDMAASLTPSDFEGSKTTKANNTETKPRRKPKFRKTRFTPPRKLTKKEIEREFYEQDKKMLESKDPAKYLEQILNRPSVKQLQQIKHIASIHKTSTGVVVLPAKETKTRKRKFITPLKKKSEEFDCTLFTDKNSDKFEQFMNTNAKNIPNARINIANQVIESQIVSKTDNKENIISDESNVQNKIKILQNIMLVSKDQKNKFEPKEGYYSNTPNTKRIDNIMEKYLNPEMEASSTGNLAAGSSSGNKIFQKFNSSLFNQSTVLLDLDSSN